MFELDGRTAMLIAGLCWIAFPLCAVTALSGYRTPAVTRWYGGGLMAGIGLALMGLRESLPGFLSVSLGNTLLIVAYLLFIQSLCLDLQRQLRVGWMVFLVLVYALSFSVRQAMDLPGLHLWWTRGWHLVLSGVLAALAWELGRRERSTNAVLIALVFGLNGAILCLSLVWAELGFAVDLVRLDSMDWAVFAVHVVLVSSVVHFSHLGMVLERSLHQRSQAAALRARAQEGQRLSQHLAHMDRQRSLGVLSDSLGHQINQPLTAILIYTQVAQRLLKAGQVQSQQLQELLEKIVFNTKRASQLIERVRGFIRPAPLHIGPVALAPLVEDVWELLKQKALKYHVSLVLPPQPPDCLVMADPVQLSQVVLNVLRNAIDAMQAVEERIIHVEYECRGDHVVLRVRDTGPGFQPDARAKAGTPFFTTKEAALGLGLSIARTILAQFRGTLTLCNGEPGGAVVEISLPALPAAQMEHA